MVRESAYLSCSAECRMPCFKLCNPVGTERLDCFVLFYYNSAFMCFFYMFVFAGHSEAVQQFSVLLHIPCDLFSRAFGAVLNTSIEKEPLVTMAFIIIY